MDSEYTLVQVYIPGNNGALPSRAYYTVGLNGAYHAKVIGITWADQTQPKDNRLIRISSDCFRSIQGSFSQTLSLCNRHEHNMGNPQGSFPFMLEVVGGTMDITLLSSAAYSNAANNFFDFCVLTLEVKAIRR